jgi:hypothetical protein
LRDHSRTSPSRQVAPTRNPSHFNSYLDPSRHAMSAGQLFDGPREL